MDASEKVKEDTAVKSNKNLIIGAILVLLLSPGCQAQDKDSAFPGGCGSHGIKISGEKVILNYGTGDAQGLVLFHNISGQAIILNHTPKDPGASAGWSTELGPGNWSALTTSVPDVDYTCSKAGPASYAELTCSKVIEVCAFSNPAFNKAENGTYWVSENKPLEATLETIKSRGIGLKD